MRCLACSFSCEILAEEQIVWFETKRGDAVINLRERFWTELSFRQLVGDKKGPQDWIA